jgi:DNA invertase Pin-like site-specific DNA recombinase
MRVIGYARVSTQEQGRSGLGLEAQRAGITEACKQRGYELLDVIEDTCSGKDIDRPGITRALAMLKAGEAEGLEVHHVNGDPTDDRILNLIPLCRDCHHEATFPGV